MLKHTQKHSLQKNAQTNTMIDDTTCTPQNNIFHKQQTHQNIKDSDAEHLTFRYEYSSEYFCYFTFYIYQILFVIQSKFMY